MKRLTVVNLSVVLALVTLGSGLYGCDSATKWIQEPADPVNDVWPLGGTTSQYAVDLSDPCDPKTYDAENADDFECTDGGAIAYVVWYGVHCYGDDQHDPVYFCDELYEQKLNPVYYYYCGCPFIIRFYEDKGLATPAKLEKEYVIPKPVAIPMHEFAMLPDGFTGTGPASKTKAGFFYKAKLEPPFDQQAGKTYWISITLDCGDNVNLGKPTSNYVKGKLLGSYHPQWFWQFCLDTQRWGNCPAQKSDWWYGDTNWHSLNQKYGIEDEMAFWLLTDKPAVPKGP